MAILVHSNTAKTKLVCGHGAVGRTCVVPAGATFSIDIKTDRAPPQGFQGYQIVLQYRNLTFVNQAGLAENRWPACPNVGFEQSTLPTASAPGRYTLGCKAGPPPRTYKGVLANVHFSCGQGSGGQIDIIGGGGAQVSFYDRPSINGNRIFLPPVNKGGKNVGDAVRVQCGTVLLGQPAGAAIDSDGDGCTDKQEGSPRPEFGGMRDAFNAWDFFDPTLDQRHRADDVLAVAQRAGLSEGAAGYSVHLDRSAAVPDFWNAGAPDGAIGAEDAAAVARLYRQDCA
jgi:hypothetical protein